jgi:hypothetical protein
MLSVRAGAEPLDFQSKYYAIGLSRTAPRISHFVLDTLGQGRLAENPVLDAQESNITTWHCWQFLMT